MSTAHRQLTLGFAAVLAATGVTAAVAWGALWGPSREKDEAARHEEDALRRVTDLRLKAEQLVAAGRGYLLTGRAIYLERFRAANDGFGAILDEVAPPPGSPRASDLVDLHHAWSRYVMAAELAAQRRSEEPDEAVVPYFERVMSPARDALEQTLEALQRDERDEVDRSLTRSGDASRRAALVVAFTSLVTLAVSLWLAWAMRGRLTEQFSALSEASARASAAVDARDQLLAVVSHDLRNPTTAILMNSTVALRKLGADGPRPQLERMQRAALRLRQLIEELLEAARVDLGRPALSRAPCELAPIVAEVVELFEPQAAAKAVKLITEVADPACTAVVDRDRVVRVLSNLCGNAVKFTPQGGEVAVRVEREEGAFVRFTVRDTGPGVPPEQRHHLFEKRSPRKREGADGLGLGLYVARGLVEAHGGSIWMTGGDGQGSSFSFRLPVEA